MNCVKIAAASILFFQSAIGQAQTIYQSKVWVADNGDGTYKNPILHADYSDPDVVRVGNDYYMTASSFNRIPGLPILHSRDLVNWRLIGYALKEQPPTERFDKVQPGGGVWAPSIRYHQGEFYIYYPDPDEGIYMVKAKDAAGPWSKPHMVKKVKGWIDPCPFWDDDGNAYLLNGVAASRSGIKSVLILNRMSKDGKNLLDDGAIIFDGHDAHPTVEGPKMYKKNGYYYILAPAGGVGQGWQLALRSKHINGPYELKKVLEQGTTNINGPHQGGLVETPNGESWFIHFQDKDAYGRVVHLNPVFWKNNWPLMGVDKDGNGVGEPVTTFKKPTVAKQLIQTPVENDEFDTNSLGLQWQWNANRQPNFAMPAGVNYGFLRLFNLPLPQGANNLWLVPNVIAQKFPAPNFTATTKLTFTPRALQEEVGLIITGLDYATISVRNTENGLVLQQTSCTDAEKGTAPVVHATQTLSTNTIYFRVKVAQILPQGIIDSSLIKGENSNWGNAACTFSYSTDGIHFTTFGKAFGAKKGKWIGATVGLYATRKGNTYENGYADIDWFRITE
jgi:beta-xylosidase